MNQEGRFGWGYTLIGSTGFSPWLWSCSHEPGYLYVRVWRFWVRFGQRRSLPSPAQVLAARQV